MHSGAAAQETHYVQTQQFAMSGALEDVAVPILDPCEVLAYLVDDVGLTCPRDVTAEYWSRQRQHYEQHPATDAHVPVSLYGDDVQVNRQGDSITAVYLSLTLFKPKKVRVCHYMIFSLRTHLIAGCFTLWPLLAYVVGRLNAAWHGVGVSRTMFALAEIKGDWPFLRKILRFEPSFTGNRVCHHCKATVFQHDHPFWDFDSTGAEVTTLDFLATMLDESCSPSPLVLVKGFSCRMVQICTMHCVNLGLCFTVNGALLMTLVRGGFFGEPAALEQCLLSAFSDFSAWRRANQVRTSQRRFRALFCACVPLRQVGNLTPQQVLDL